MLSKKLQLGNRRRKGWFLNAYCHLVIKSVRHDSPPWHDGQALAEMMIGYQLKFKLTREALAIGLGVSLGTLKNWERSRTKPVRRLWKTIRLFAINHNSFSMTVSAVAK